MIKITEGLTQPLSGEYQDKIVEIMRKDAALNSSVPKTIRKSIEWLLRMVNSYYSNRIEGNPTHPKDFLSTQNTKSEGVDFDHFVRELLVDLEVQLKEASIGKGTDNVCSEAAIKAIHKAYFKGLPEQSFIIKDPDGNDVLIDGKPKLIQPGEYRESDVIVGRHIPPGHDEVGRYMKWIDKMYNKEFHGTEAMPAVACFHHRMAWLHPFEDGNGRTIRLITDGLMRKSGFGGYGLWSIARGFGRDKAAYYEALSNADQKRYHDSDGRGVLSDRGLRFWIEYFIDTCLDQVQFFSDLLEPQKLNTRINYYFDMRTQGALPAEKGVELPRLDVRARDIYKLLLESGSMSRTEIAKHFNKTEQTLRKTINQMHEEGLISAPPRSKVGIRLSTHTIEYFFPGLW